MNVLSLFDGKSGAMAALDYLNVKVDNYYACEIDKYAQQVSRYHYPDIIRLGDVTKVVAKDLPKIDILFAGYPCQAFSFAGKQLNFEDPRGKLFFEVVRLLNELQPKFFLLENVRMKKDIENEINKLVGVKPVLINSALLGSQNRLRNYWCGGYKDGKVYPIEISQPADAGIYLKDIIEYGESDRDKSQTVLSTIWKENAKSMVQRNKKGLIVKVTNVNPSGKGMNGDVYSIAGKCPTLTTNKGEGVKITNSVNPISRVIDDGDITEEEFYSRVERFRLIKGGAQRGRYIADGKHTDTSVASMAGLTEQCVELREDGKSNCLTTVQKDSLAISIIQRGHGFNKGGTFTEKSPTLTSNSWQDNNHLSDGISYRKLTPIECERLQNYQDNYTLLGVDDKGNQVKISNSQRYKMLGNGFDRFTIAHCLKQILRSQEIKNTCIKCKWLDDPDFNNVCVNSESVNCADFMSHDDSCEQFEELENDN